MAYLFTSQFTPLENAPRQAAETPARGSTPHASSLTGFTGALALDRLLPKKIRGGVAAIVNLLVLLLCVGMVYSILRAQLPLPPDNVLPLFPFSFAHLLGVLFLLVAVRLLFFALEGFYLARIFGNSSKMSGDNILDRLTYPAAHIWYGTAKSVRSMDRVTVRGLAHAFAAGDFGKNALLRLGISSAEYHAAISVSGQDGAVPGEPAIVRLEAYIREQEGEVTIADILEFLFAEDKPFQNFILSRQVTKQDLAGTGAWIERTFALKNKKIRWWSRENLGRISGIGKQWSFGYTVFLRQFAQPIESAQTHELVGKQREIELLESALLKTSGANVMIIGEPGIGKHTVLQGLARMIDEGKVFPDIEHKEVLALSVGQVLGAGKTKGETEALLLRILAEASAAGNIIFAIDEFPEFIESLENLGIAPGTLLGPYLAHPAIHIVGLGTSANLRRILEREKALVDEFVTIELTEPSPADLVEIIQDAVPGLEESLKHRVVITYPAIAAIAEGVEQYLLSGGGAPERAASLLEEVAHECIAGRILFCTREIVLEYLEKKTRIPLGAITADEKEKLLHLEDEMHKRVINQKDAIAAIANAIRRTRASMSDSRRPIGTFLFLGPTGVGKTETAKALAAVYFGDADAMTRFDMTEYQSEDGLTRLIGSSAANQHGMLASAMRSTPYAVVLLDEFEKSHAKVQDLFLQILDEGFFTDAFGERVSMRNCIIIATSNAGSIFILDALKRKIPFNEMQAGVISHIQSNGIFKPELLNRFDSVIVFTPLGPEELKQVSRLMLETLALRLKKQNLNLVISDELIAAVAAGGYSATFGARPMRRFIQDRIEKIIADKIIAGSLKDGDTISLTAQDLS
ncbi:MAG: ATP-dependent Clp protease ATP-binding subunit [Candidatus Sungbacteria bacterium]|nr:ATP-dependent Clp protease ATP-binding subunit [Candidatus Sungbacteria bacterium]